MLSAAHRRPFQQAIELIARAAAALEERGIEPPILLVPIEDMIADRMGQALAGPRRDEAMRDQAIWLYRFANSLDRVYLDRRIREETVNQATAATLEAWAHEDD